MDILSAMGTNVFAEKVFFTVVIIQMGCGAKNVINSLDTSTKNMFSLIVAIDLNGGISKDGNIPWFFSDDLKHFKYKTLNQVVIMGRNTWDSLTKKPLPKRKNIILTHRDDIPNHKDVYVVHSIRELWNCTKQFHDLECFIIGGATLYNYMLNNDFVNKLYITTIYGNYDCDTHINYPLIPPPTKEGWKEYEIKDPRTRRLMMDSKYYEYHELFK